uniref:40S ribosomal protein S19 n=1 Tax=Polyblepharides amylifera TaxID=1486889 RepID=A0A7R9SWN7_9CHLO|mmetsp:Transcript_1226/g.1748  ORF Transcript_1226/g.1748 Transcript_1226/m.1748 type:complete len:148 (+) Transcript_1226:76-519(+)|eukprot:CAMPEP_0196570942 /NCGR_PEP_ID=MMETSP1081-20130531/1095_1 /TAXON_ID=36882 /ORGANISM="Pyramimonas amylifera, Strain CCMP720" /LENGTH=147 /DNA_ID=CAMNT_0041887653 /DNA_START=114 /DNA_END=557 /DNA_ORIENTATION=-
MSGAPKTVKDVTSHEFVQAYAAYLRSTGKFETPTWVDLVKTSTRKELAPYDPDWFYVRAASVARQIYLRGGRGVGGLRKRYGGTKRDGSRPNHHAIASGSIIRHILQQLEILKIVEKSAKGGRQITSDGQRDLDRIAGRCAAVTAEA